MDNRFKIKPEDYELMNQALIQVHRQYPKAWEKYQQCGYSRKRLRWDAWRNAKLEGTSPTSFICDRLYDYLNDDHIDSALKHITDKLWPENSE